MSRFTSLCATRIQCRKPCSDGVSRALIVEREVEEFVERVDGFDAEPGQNLLAAVPCAEHMRVERKRRHRARRLAELVERAVGGVKRRLFAGTLAQSAAQRALAAVGEGKKLHLRSGQTAGS